MPFNAWVRNGAEEKGKGWGGSWIQPSKPSKESLPTFDEIPKDEPIAR
jgi:hypothetical protein